MNTNANNQKIKKIIYEDFGYLCNDLVELDQLSGLQAIEFVGDGWNLDFNPNRYTGDCTISSLQITPFGGNVASALKFLGDALKLKSLTLSCGGGRAFYCGWDMIKTRIQDTEFTELETLTLLIDEKCQDNDDWWKLMTYGLVMPKADTLHLRVDDSWNAYSFGKTKDLVELQKSLKTVVVEKDGEQHRFGVNDITSDWEQTLNFLLC